MSAPTFFESIALPLIDRLGVPVAPCYPWDVVRTINGVDKKMGKTVDLPDPLNQMSKDPAQIRAWGLTKPNANVCVYAQQIEGGLCFVDKDGAISLRAKYQQDTGKPFPKTLLVRSSVVDEGSGAITKGHWYFRQTPRTMALDGNISESKTGGLFSFRVKNEYVASIGSTHPNTGKPYEVAEDYPVLPMPDDLLDWLLKQVVDAPKTREEVSQRGKYGLHQRYPALMSELGHLWNRGYDKEGLVAAGLAWARTNFDIGAEEFNEDLVTAEIEQYHKTYGDGVSNKVVLNNGAAQQAAPAPIEITPELLLKEFPSYDGTVPDALPMLIQGFMPKGVGFFGSLAGTVKTWLGLSITKALTTGQPLWGQEQFAVKEKVAVLYLVPEASDASFKWRMHKMGITQDKTLFRYRTISQGRTKPLSDELTLAVIRELLDGGKRQVLVICDTAVRFFRGKDENSSMDNSLVNDSDTLRSMGADIAFLHHSPKSMKDATEMTTENVLRGSGDFGAMADYVYGFRRDDAMYANGEGAEEVEAVCTKPRDFDPPLPFRLQLKRASTKAERDGMELMGEDVQPTVSVIDETGNLKYINNTLLKSQKVKLLAQTLKTDPYISANKLLVVLKMKKEHLKDFCHANGWRQVDHQTVNAKGAYTTKKMWKHDDSVLLAGQTEVPKSAQQEEVAA